MLSFLLSALLASAPAAIPSQHLEARPALGPESQAFSGPNPPFDPTEEEAIQALVAWHDDPVLYVRQVFGAVPDEWQAETLRAVARDQRVGMSACKGPGKSCVLAWVVWWWEDTREDAQCMCTSITEANLRDNLWKEIAFWYGKAPHLQRIFDVRGERVVHRDRPKTWWVSARAFAQQADRTAQANTLAGFHGRHVLVVLDEMGDYPEGVVQAAEAIFSTTDTEAKLVAAWNPTTTDGPAYRVCTRDRKRWTIVHITGDPEDPNRSTRISKDWAQAMIDDWGRDSPVVMVNVLGLFPDHAPDKLLGANDVQLAMERDVSPLAFRSDPRIWGIDPAYSEVGDRSVLFKRQGIVAFRPNVWRGLDGPQLAGRVGNLLLEAEKAGELPDAIFVDRGGVGASCYDQLRLLGWGHLVHGVDFAGAANDPRYADKRAEMWMGMAQWIRKGKGCLPTDPDLPGELTAPKVDWRARGKRTCFVLESKKDLKERGLPSPDKADALALTFAEPVNPLGRHAREKNQRPAETRHEKTWRS